jgi:hypothetical protein
MAPSSSRNGARVLWITIHTAEGIRKAADLKAFFDRATDRSAHAVADDQTLIENCVPYDRAAWTLRYGNTRSDNLELCGFAAWSRNEWLTNHKGMLNFAADWARSRCLARGIPIVKLSPADVAAGKSGVIGHVDYTLGTHDGTHTDPGPGFPWDYVIARAGQQEIDMTPKDLLDTAVTIRNGDGSVAKTESIRSILEWTDNRTNVVRADVEAALGEMQQRMDKLQAGVDALVAHVLGNPV